MLDKPKELQEICQIQNMGVPLSFPFPTGQKHSRPLRCLSFDFLDPLIFFPWQQKNQICHPKRRFEVVEKPIEICSDKLSRFYLLVTKKYFKTITTFKREQKYDFYMFFNTSCSESTANACKHMLQSISDVDALKWQLSQPRVQLALFFFLGNGAISVPVARWLRVGQRRTDSLSA